MIEGNSISRAETGGIFELGWYRGYLTVSQRLLTRSSATSRERDLYRECRVTRSSLIFTLSPRKQSRSVPEPANTLQVHYPETRGTSEGLWLLEVAFLPGFIAANL